MMMTNGHFSRNVVAHRPMVRMLGPLTNLQGQHIRSQKSYGIKESERR